MFLNSHSSRSRTVNREIGRKSQSDPKSNQWTKKPWTSISTYYRVPQAVMTTKCPVMSWKEQIPSSPDEFQSFGPMQTHFGHLFISSSKLTCSHAFLSPPHEVASHHRTGQKECALDEFFAWALERGSHFRLPLGSKILTGNLRYWWRYHLNRWSLTSAYLRKLSSCCW